MNFFNSSNKSNTNENQDTPFFNKPNHSIFDEQLYRTEEEHAFNFFKTSNIKAKPSLLSQLEAEQVEDYKIEQAPRKVEEKRNEQKLNINFSQYKEPFSFQVELNQVNVDASKNNAKANKESNERRLNFLLNTKEKAEKDSKWKNKSIIPLQMNSEPISFQQDKKNFQFKRNEKNKPNQPQTNLKTNLSLEKPQQDPRNVEDKIKSIPIQKRQHLFLSKKPQEKPNQQNLNNEIKKREQKQKQVTNKQPQVQQSNQLQVITSQNSNETDFSYNLNVNSEFLHLKTKMDKKPPAFLGFPRFAKKSSNEQPVQAKPLNEVMKPIKAQVKVQKKVVGQVEINKNREQVVETKIQSKQEKPVIENTIRSAKKISFLNHIKPTPSKLPDFSFRQSNQHQNEQKTSEALNIQPSLQNSKPKLKTDTNILPKGPLASTQLKNTINEDRQKAIEGQKILKKTDLKQQLRKFGSRPTQKGQPNYFADRMKKKNDNKTQIKLSSASKILPVAPKQPKQQPVPKQTISKQKTFLKQVLQKQSKQKDFIKQNRDLTNAQSIYQSVTPKVDSFLRTESIFVRSMMLVLQMGGESEKLRQVILSKTQMFSELSFLEKRCSNRINSLLNHKPK